MSGFVERRHWKGVTGEDAAWLAEYRDCGSEAAFRALVDRHLPLVYSTAVRMVNGDSHRAQDICQSVFTDLARSVPSLPQGVLLAGWLHRTTRFTALEVLRAERRRAKREQESTWMKEQDTSETETAWASLRPVLDEALDQLAEPDRHALLLRFFGQHSLADVGSALGIAEDAARKRVARALEKLRQRLVARGITTTATALSCMLESRCVEAVPAGLGAHLAGVAWTAAGTAVTPPLEILTLMSSAKTLATAAAVSVVLLTLGVGYARYHASRSSGSPDSNTGGIPENAAAEVSPDPGGSGRHPTPDPGTDPRLAAALLRVQKALEDRKPTRRFPNPEMERALAALGGRRAQALPLLLAALGNSDGPIRDRAIDGLRQLGGEARDALPELLRLLREGSVSAGLIVPALENIGPSPAMVPDLVDALKQNPAARLSIANSLSSPAWGEPASISNALKPLLADPDPAVRQMAGYSLAMLLRNRAGDEVFKVAVEGLNSPDDDARGLALSALRNVGSDPADSSGRVTRERLGAGSEAAVPALIAIANDGGNQDQQRQALMLLDAIDPGLRPGNPEMHRLLEARERDAAFAAAAREGRLSLPELVEGIHGNPEALPVTAAALAAMGPDAEGARAALLEALASLASTPVAAPDRARVAQSRDAVVDALQKIAPEEPRAWFTERDLGNVLSALDDPEFLADGNRRQRLAVAFGSVPGLVDGQPFQMNPDQMHRFMDALKEADPGIHATVLAKVRDLDPRFGATRAP
ncbi:MAG: sigma-70 family RNA polymerase sigma factor [Verrucomicrobiales bacterium]|nr:sigma-70 family RNA polymerase sigma factor [Verrucomicrobiales bacterium]